MFRRITTRKPRPTRRSPRERRGAVVLGSLMTALVISGTVHLADSSREGIASPSAGEAALENPHAASAREADGALEAKPRAILATAADAAVLARLRQTGGGLSPDQIRRLAEAIVAEAARHRFEPALVMAVIHVESSGRPTAVSPVGALGLMQIMPPTGEELAGLHGIPWRGPDTLLDPVINVKLGVAYLRTLADRYDDMNTALAAYNWGPGRIDRRLRAGEGVPKLYPDRVMKAYDTTKREIAVGRS